MSLSFRVLFSFLGVVVNLWRLKAVGPGTVDYDPDKWSKLPLWEFTLSYGYEVPRVRTLPLVQPHRLQKRGQRANLLPVPGFSCDMSVPEGENTGTLEELVASLVNSLISFVNVETQDVVQKQEILSKLQNEIPRDVTAVFSTVFDNNVKFEMTMPHEIKWIRYPDSVTDRIKNAIAVVFQPEETETTEPDKPEDLATRLNTVVKTKESLVEWKGPFRGFRKIVKQQLYFVAVDRNVRPPNQTGKIMAILAADRNNSVNLGTDMKLFENFFNQEWQKKQNDFFQGGEEF